MWAVDVWRHAGDTVSTPGGDIPGASLVAIVLAAAGAVTGWAGIRGTKRRDVVSAYESITDQAQEDAARERALRLEADARAAAAEASIRALTSELWATQARQAQLARYVVDVLGGDPTKAWPSDVTRHGHGTP